MISQAAGPLEHGGDLAAARRLFPHAPEPFIDLSTGINPYPYKVPTLPPALFERLPQSDELARLAAVAAKAYGAPAPACVVAAPGTQILLPLIAALKPPGRAAILGPTYAEHARTAALAGHRVIETQELRRVGDADLAIVVNPNNPDGRIVATADLLALAGELRSRSGILVVDEAFVEVGPPQAGLAGEVEHFTGISDPYEEPLSPDITVDSSVETVEESTARILAQILNIGMPHDDPSGVETCAASQ